MQGNLAHAALVCYAWLTHTGRISESCWAWQRMKSQGAGGVVERVLDSAGLVFQLPDQHQSAERPIRS